MEFAGRTARLLHLYCALVSAARDIATAAAASCPAALSDADSLEILKERLAAGEVHAKLGSDDPQRASAAIWRGLLRDPARAPPDVLPSPPPAEPRKALSADAKRAEAAVQVVTTYRLSPSQRFSYDAAFSPWLSLAHSLYQTPPRVCSF